MCVIIAMVYITFDQSWRLLGVVRGTGLEEEIVVVSVEALVAFVRAAALNSLETVR